MLSAAVALIVSHLLPGAGLVRLLGLGKSPLESWVMSAVLGGPIAALLHLAGLLAGSAGVYWTLLAAANLASLAVLWRRPRPAKAPDASGGGGRGPLGALAVLLLVALGAYHATTGHLFSLDDEGNLLMDPAFQEDALFHVGLVRALETRYLPELLSFGGVEARYHLGHHLQLAAWSRHFGIDPFDGLYRVAPSWLLVLMVLSCYAFARRFSGRPWTAVLACSFLFAGGFGFLFHRAPGADWWSLVFMDATLVSILLSNPLLPALPVLFVGLTCLDDYLTEGHENTLLGAAFAMAALFAIKEVLAAQVLAGLGVAAILARGSRAARTRRALVVLSVVSAPVFVLIVGAMREANTAMVVRPLEIVRYATITLGRDDWASLLAAFGRGDVDSAGIAVPLGATALWLVGFLGVRLIGLPGVLRDAACRTGSVREALAVTVLMGIPLTLVFRIAPAEASGLSRDEGLNNALWFATHAGILLWLWTAEACSRLAARSPRLRAAIAAGVAPFAFPCTVQHFAQKASLPPDAIPASAVEATRALRESAGSDELVLEPLNRVRPSLPAYLAGRPVVVESYVGYNYLFVERQEVDFRQHAVAQFWRSEDAGYAFWLLRAFDVRWIYLPSGRRLHPAVEQGSELVFENEAASIYGVDGRLPRGLPIATPERIPVGIDWARYFGRGWSAPESRPRRRWLDPASRAALYVPLDEGATLVLDLLLEPDHGGGMVAGEDSFAWVEPGEERARLVRPSWHARRGLNRIELSWRGERPLAVVGIELEVFPPGAPDIPDPSPEWVDGGDDTARLLIYR